MKNLEKEVSIISSNEDKVVLTNQRIMMKEKVWGKSYKIFIFLEDISSIETRYKSNVLLLILAVIAAIGGFVIGENTVILGGLIVGALFVVLWWFSRKNFVQISSDGGSSLKLSVVRMSDEAVEDFVTEVQEAKLKRINSLYKI